jgi:hypothetical protein
MELVSVPGLPISTTQSADIVRLTNRDQKRARSRDARLSCCDCIPPFGRRLGSEGPQCRSRDEMALKVESVVDGGMHAEETLSGTSRFARLAPRLLHQ